MKPTFSRTDKQYASNGIEYWWDNCKRDCGCEDPNKKSTDCKCRNSNCARGSDNRMQKRDYALQVLFHMGLWDGQSQNAICPLTGKEFDISLGEVDKVHEHKRYTEFNVVFVSLQGNQERGTLQQHYGDIPGLSRYAQDVAKASALASVTRKAHLVKPAYRVRSRNVASDVLPHERPARDAHNVRYGPYGRV